MNGLLVRQAEIWKNIGDYIQSLAQQQYWDHIDVIVDRESLDTVRSPHPGEKINLIMNSWWMWSPEHFPPSDDINPLFVSFHISPNAADIMLSEKGVAYFKKYQPIGARDYGTLRILEEHGIQSYFSGCLTLTLGQTYTDQKKTNDVYIVDPEYKLFGPRAVKEWIRICWLSMVRWKKRIDQIDRKFIFAKKTVFSKVSDRFNRRICATLFYDEYRKFFNDDILLNAHFLSHRVNVKEDYPTNEACMELAQKLVRNYAKAKLVITSKIHAALPSLGLGTPVVFVDSWAIDSGEIKGRLEGLRELFNYRLEVTINGLKAASDDMAFLVKNGPVSLMTPLQNSDAFIPYRDALIERTRQFVNSCNNHTNP